MAAIRYTDPNHTRGVIEPDGEPPIATVLPPDIAPVRAVYDRLMAAGVQITPFAPPPLPPIRIAKGDIWRRATDEEAAVIDAALQAQPLRLRNLFRDADYLSSDDAMWPALLAGFVTAFGAARAAELLAPSA